jgi:magnesium transporter
MKAKVMKCQLEYSEMPSTYPKDEVDIYRVVKGEDGKYYVRLELMGFPYYFTITKDKVVTHTKEALETFKEIEPKDCSPWSIFTEIVYEMIYILGEKRNEYYAIYEKLFEEAIAGEPIEGIEVVQLRRKAYQLFSDATVLYFVVKKLSKELEEQVEDDAKFSLDRAELLITRLSDLYNLYYTKVQYDLNEVIKKLTSVSILFLPITAVASVYAVTFPSIWQSLLNISALIFLSPVIIVTAIMAVYLRRKGWL